MTLRDLLRKNFQMLFGQQWPALLGGIFIGFLNVFLFVFYQPWTTLDGILNWGNWALDNLGVINAEALSPLLRSGSVINFGLLFGAMMSALLASQFGVRVGPVSELVKGAVGGLLLGTGAVIARGCNIGGFFSGASAFSLAGLTMGVGLALGAVIGVIYLMWEADRAILRRQKPNDTIMPAPEKGKGNPPPPNPGPANSPLCRPRNLQVYAGALVFLALLAWAAAYGGFGFADRGVILLFGVILGVVMQRSRVCFAQAFREPFLSGRAEHTRAMLLALLISVIGFAIVKVTILEKADEFVRPTFWWGALLGGVIFGVGMVLAGGCGGGTIWRAGEGHVKLWVALLGYTLSASLVNEWLINTGLIDQLGEAVFLPNIIGWEWAVIALVAIIVLWFLWAQWNEITRRFAAL